MFKINPNPTFTAKVSISIPGQEKQAVIDVEFRHLNRPGIRDYFGGLEGKTDAEGLAEIIVGWKGPDVAYSKETLGELLDNYPASAAEFFDAFRRELLESRRKN